MEKDSEKMSNSSTFMSGNRISDTLMKNLIYKLRWMDGQIDGLLFVSETYITVMDIKVITYVFFQLGEF